MVIISLQCNYLLGGIHVDTTLTLLQTQCPSSLQ